jgi:hemerythrin
MRLEWDEKFAVNVKEIDDQHKTFIELINKMFEGLEGEHIQPIVDNTLTELPAFARDHFAVEEKYCELCDYAGSDELINEHKILKLKLDELLKERETADDIYAYYFELLHYLTDWLSDHMITIDVKMGPILNSHGYY